MELDTKIKTGLASAAINFYKYAKGEFFQKRSEDDEVTFKASVFAAGETAGQMATVAGNSVSMMGNFYINFTDTYACKNTKHRARYAGAVVGEVGFEGATNVMFAGVPLLFSISRRGLIYAHKGARALKTADNMPEFLRALRRLTAIFQKMENDLIPENDGLMTLQRGSDELAEGYFVSPIPGGHEIPTRPGQSGFLRWYGSQRTVEIFGSKFGEKNLDLARQLDEHSSILAKRNELESFLKYYRYSYNSKMDYDTVQVVNVAKPDDSPKFLLKARNLFTKKIFPLDASFSALRGPSVFFGAGRL